MTPYNPYHLHCSWLHVWNGNEMVFVPQPTIAEVFNMEKALRDIDLCFSGIPMTERDDDDFGAEVILTVGDVRNIRGILDRIDGVVT